MNIPEEKRIRVYELTCLVPAEYTQEELEKIKAKLSKIIENAQGEVKEVEEWGKKELAYTIKDAGKSYQEANYLHFVFEAEAEQANAIRDTLNITDEVIRHLLVVQD